MFEHEHWPKFLVEVPTNVFSRLWQRVGEELFTRWRKKKKEPHLKIAANWPPLWSGSHNLLSAISGTFGRRLGGPKCLQWFIRDLFSTQHKQAHGLLITHRVTSAVALARLTAGEQEGCLGLMEFFNSRVMGDCGLRNDYFSPLTGALSELARASFGATTWCIIIIIIDAMLTCSEGFRCISEQRGGKKKVRCQVWEHTGVPLVPQWEYFLLICLVASCADAQLVQLLMLDRLTPWLLPDHKGIVR